MRQIIAGVVALSFALLTGAAAAESADVSIKLIATVKDIQAQQILIAENQGKIEAKLAVVSEAIRLARIYSGRGG